MIPVGYLDAVIKAARRMGRDFDARTGTPMTNSEAERVVHYYGLRWTALTTASMVFGEGALPCIAFDGGDGDDEGRAA